MVGRPALAEPSLPGRVAIALPCTAEAQADCWTAAPRIQRFAPPFGESGTPFEADVRVAWQDDALLVRVEGLPEGASLELGLAPREEDDSLRDLWPAELGPGVHRLAVVPPLESGTARALRLSARVPSADGGLDVLPWAPVGDGDVHHAGLLAVLEDPAPSLGLSVTRTEQGIMAKAPGATRVRLDARRNVVPTGSRGVPPPWRAEGEDRASGAPPDAGWVDIEAIWHDPQGKVIDIDRQRTWWTPPPARASTHGLFPIPQAIETRAGSGWTPRSGDRICAPESIHAEAAKLLAGELERFTGTDLQVVERGRCTVRFRNLDTMVDALPAGDAAHASAFGVEVRADGVRLGVRDPRTAVWAALAVVDLVGTDGHAPPVALLDWPDVDTRVLYHSINLRARPDWNPTDHVRFLERVVARGRYTDLVLAPNDSFVLPGAENFARPTSRPTAELEAVIARGRELGMNVWPGVTGLAHARWMTDVDGRLADDVTGEVLDLRDGRTRQALTTVLDALLGVFGGPQEVGRIHLGHDEVMWRTRARFGDERNPSTAGSPRSVLLAESLRWHMDWARSRDLAPTVWSDTLLAGWNGGREGAWRALDLLDDKALDDLIVMSWAELGDPWTHLGARGIPVQRVHTGYVDWKRAGLPERLDEIDAEGLGLFVPSPWAAHGPAPGSRNRFYHSSAIMLAGATGWRADLTGFNVARTCSALADTPAFAPGREGPPRDARPLVPAGSPAPDIVEWPESAATGGVTFDTRHAVMATEATPANVDVGALSLSVLLADSIRHDAALPLLRAIRSGRTEMDRAVGFARLHASDAPPVDIPLVHGLDVYAIDGGSWAGPLWRTAGVVALASPHAASITPRATDRRLWRKDLSRPDGLPITRAEFHVSRDGVTLLIGGAAAHDGP